MFYFKNFPSPLSFLERTGKFLSRASASHGENAYCHLENAVKNTSYQTAIKQDKSIALINLIRINEKNNSTTLLAQPKNFSFRTYPGFAMVFSTFSRILSYKSVMVLFTYVFPGTRYLEFIRLQNKTNDSFSTKLTAAVDDTIAIASASVNFRVPHCPIYKRKCQIPSAALSVLLSQMMSL